MLSFSLSFSSAKDASGEMARASSDQKNAMLFVLAQELEMRIPEILQENQKDIVLAQQEEKNASIDRLFLNEARIKNMASEVRNVAGLPDEVSVLMEQNTHLSGFFFQQVRVPFGVIGMIYESRPNVTIDAAVLALKSGNAVILKGGKEARNSNRILAKILQETLEKSGFSPELVQFLDTDDRSATLEMLSARGKIDLLIPRGGRGLIDFVRKNAEIPFIETGASVVHTFVDESADFEMASEIIFNEKTRRFAVCNALDTVLIHEKIAENFLKKLLLDFEKRELSFQKPHTEFYADEKAQKILKKITAQKFPLATEKEFATEWLEAKASLAIVSDIDAALRHIRQFSLGHSESIVTENAQNAERFLREVDAACVYWNVSTAFSDGAQFGLGAEMGISTQKMHARGPFALRGLTTTKWVIRGKGQIRQ